MSYEETIDYLYSRTPLFQNIGQNAYKEGLYNTQLLDEHFGHPHRSYMTIHIAGTNGKGSCSHTIASILQASGYRVGLYTSPHLIDFRERIRVNGEPISKERVCQFVKQEKDFFEPLSPSFFEVTTALALLYFKEQNVDVAVIEVGLGGRLDCTNIIRPELSIITNISFDHTQFLGATLEKIAAEKAGIIKEGVPVVIGETTNETLPVFKHYAELMNAPIVLADKDLDVSEAKTVSSGMLYQSKRYGQIQGDLGGLYQIKNTNTIIHALEYIKTCFPKVTNESVRKGFACVAQSTGLKGRWEKISDAPLTYCDTGHNPAGIEYVTKQILLQQYKHLYIILGMVSDKDLNAVLGMMPKEATYYFCTASVKRSRDSIEVMNKARNHGLHGFAYNSVKDAYNAALNAAESDDMIFIGGSSYVVADLLTMFAEKHTKQHDS